MPIKKRNKWIEALIKMMNMSRIGGTSFCNVKRRRGYAKED